MGARTLSAPRSGPRLLLLPGMDGTGRLFRAFRAALPDTVEADVVAYPPDRSLGLPALAALARERLEAGRPATVVAESFSGPVAIALAAGRPRGLRALALVATFARSPLPPSLARTVAAAARAPLFRAPLPLAVLRYLLASPGDPGRVAEEVAIAIRGVAPAVLAHRLREILAVDARPLLPLVAAPTLILAGASDRLVRASARRDLAGGIAGSVTRILDGPHLLLQIRPAEAAREILAFDANV